jgi:hypothetical protein
MDLVHGTLSIKLLVESFAPSGAAQPGGGQGKISVKERETGNGEREKYREFSAFRGPSVELSHRSSLETV